MACSIESLQKSLEKPDGPAPETQVQNTGLWEFTDCENKAVKFMNTYLILIRGVNVGRKNLLPMKELSVVLESRGFENVKTYIQSGNIVLMAEQRPKGNLETPIY